MNDPSKTFNPKSSQDISKSTSSLASEDGPTPSGSQDGLTTDPSGPAPVPVSRFRAQDSGKAMPINDICGPLFTTSLPSAGLQRSLESKLRARMGSSGSPLYVLTWSEVDMPAGVPILRRRASGRLTSGSGSSGWPTPMVVEPEPEDGKDSPARQAMNRNYTNLGRLVHRMAGWPTPCTPSGGRSTSIEKMDATGKTVDGRKHTASLEHAVKFAGWATPNAMTGHTRGLATDPEVAARRKERGHQVNLEDQIGTTSSSSPAPTEKRGSLASEFVGWLMGYPVSWKIHAPTKRG